MGRTPLPLMLGCLAAVTWASLAGAQELVPARPYAAPGYVISPYAAPFSRDARLREQQVVARQLAVLDWTQWQSNAWSLYGPEELWLFGPPLTFAWDFPPVEQPIGQRRIYDGRGGYSSGPVYADQLAPPPRPAPIIPQPAPVVPQPEAAEAVVGARPPRPRADAPAARAPPADAPRRLFSW
ncbi:MAG: hypothetical protein L0Y71_11420 [Gemmataceae bacterium]|nr:hypothetical protein [Gemmataceae bacterium]